MNGLPVIQSLYPNRMIKHKHHDSYVGFSNLFRYKLLLEKGDYWVDTDVICLKSFLHSADYVLASERLLKPAPDSKVKVVTYIIKALNFVTGALRNFDVVLVRNR